MNTASPQHIYKILTKPQWEQFHKEGKFAGSKLDQKDGFIHCCEESHIQHILDNFFRGQEDLVLVQMNPSKLVPGSLRIEANKPGGTEYAHVYASIPLDAVVGRKMISGVGSDTPSEN